MARMFDALKQRVLPGPAAAPPPAVAPDEPPAPREPEPEADDPAGVSYIEVGPRKYLDGSPDVMAVALPAGPAPAPADPEPPCVRFQPFEADGGGSRFGAELVAYHAPDHAPAEQYRAALAALADARPGGPPQVVALVPAAAGRGATVALLNLAVTAARAGRRRVAVIDGNLREPGVASRLGLRDAPGLRDVLAGAATLEDALQSTEQVNLTALTAGRPGPADAAHAPAAAWRSLLRQFRARFDLVLIDAPPADAGPETPLWAAADAVLVAAPEADADPADLDRVRRAIAGQGGRPAGLVLTR